MTDKDMFKEAFPQTDQVGGDWYKNYKIQPYEFIRKNNLNHYQGVIIKYVVRYLQKGKQEDLRKIIHYTKLEIHHLDDEEVKRKYRKK